MNNSLTMDISEEEVKKALFIMYPEKAPGPDGMIAIFYQRFLPSIKEELVDVIRNFFHMGSFGIRLNATNICMIPKKDKPKQIAKFRPISLCNVGCKIISKI